MSQSGLENVSEIEFSEVATQTSTPFVGQWNQLISTTNWEKGEIICQWRDSLEEAGASKSEISDEAWSQLVGGVTPQHVGRLRRTYERFGHVFKEYEGIYWSHFYASLDWDDAEMWLEGAVQSRWSVSKMRHQRWETLGKIPSDKPTDTDIVATEFSEEAQSLELSEGRRNTDRDYVEGPVHEGPDFGDQEKPNKGEMQTESISSADASAGSEVRPFESFQELPEDVMDASNAFKLAIIRHKSEQWNEISQGDIVDLLEALKQLVMAPSELAE